VRILIHDYAGHPFQLELSEELAHRGHEVLHIHFDGLQTPKAAFNRAFPQGLAVRGVRTAKPLDKSKLATRYLREREYGHAVADEIRAFRPAAVLSANTPLDVQASLIRAARSVSARFYFWMQDFYSLALRRLLPRKLPILGSGIARYYEHVEREQLRQSDGVVFITPDFLEVASDWGIRPQRCHVIENWAPLSEVTLRAQSNPWSRAHNLNGQRVFLYSGTLGMKHNPDLLLKLAQRTQHLGDVVVAVVSSGPAADFLRARQETNPLPNLQLFPTQSFSDLPYVLGSATVLLAILEPEAGVFSVPSKVLTYLCAGRPLLCAMPRRNLAARIVVDSGAGMVVDPRDADAFTSAAMELLDDPFARERMGDAAVDYATSAFDAPAIAAQFERVLSGAPAIWNTHEQRTVSAPLRATPRHAFNEGHASDAAFRMRP
jgi:glycosyltransferase involved in cell wall biosynthesis